MGIGGGGGGAGGAERRGQKGHRIDAPSHARGMLGRTPRPAPPRRACSCSDAPARAPPRHGRAAADADADADAGNTCCSLPLPACGSAEPRRAASVAPVQLRPLHRAPRPCLPFCGPPPGSRALPAPRAPLPPLGRRPRGQRGALGPRPEPVAGPGRRRGPPRPLQCVRRRAGSAPPRPRPLGPSAGGPPVLSPAGRPIHHIVKLSRRWCRGGAGVGPHRLSWAGPVVVRGTARDADHSGAAARGLPGSDPHRQGGMGPCLGAPTVGLGQHPLDLQRVAQVACGLAHVTPLLSCVTAPRSLARGRKVGRGCAAAPVTPAACCLA
jgi:hypothetical protein